jgi:hypothetical protein
MFKEIWQKIKELWVGEPAVPVEPEKPKAKAKTKGRKKKS